MSTRAKVETKAKTCREECACQCGQQACGCRVRDDVFIPLRDLLKPKKVKR